MRQANYLVRRELINGFTIDKPLEQQPRRVLIDLIYSLYATNDKIFAEKEAIIQTQNKFLHAFGRAEERQDG